MKKSNLVYLILVVIIIIGLGTLLTFKNKINPCTISNNGQAIFFYGDGCPHCTLVEKFFTENNITSTIQFIQKEVYKNPDNAREMAGYAQKCGLDPNQLGVPFFWTGSKCLSGDKPIIQCFKDQTGIK